MLHCPTCGRHYTSDQQFCPEDKTPLQADATVQGDILQDPLIGQTLDEKYRLEARLGIGGMGTVYRARHLLIDRAVAVKVLNPRFVEDEAARVRFQREAKAAGRLHHVNAVAVTDFGQTSGGYVYIVMELLEGRTLREILAREAPLDSARAVSIMLQTAAAVAAAHEAGVIHRDLKPANIFVTQHADAPAVVKVLDFGIAKLAAESLEEDEEPKNLTQFGAMIGTPRYMSPEQCTGAELTPAADVYSLGVILYEMLTGSVPFSGSTPLGIAMKHASELPRSLREIVSAIPPELEQVVLHALEKRAEDRPANAAEFGRELFATAERLGLEHAAVTSGPDIESLRKVGTESPSGRLVIDLSRLRENRAATSSGDELTVISEADAARRALGKINGDGASIARQVDAARPPTTRVDIPLERSRKPLVMIFGGFTIVGLILIIALLVGRLPSMSTLPVAPVVVSPSPEASISPTPSPSAQPSPSKEATEDSKNKPKKHEEKNEGGILGFGKKIFRTATKPFKKKSAH